MDAARKKELKEAYKEIKTLYGVVKLTNQRNGKVFLDSYSNIKNKEYYLRSQLDDDRHPNAALQADWKTFGSGAFIYEELIEKDASEVADARWEAKQLEQMFLDQLQPFGENGYNKPL